MEELVLYLVNVKQVIAMKRKENVSASRRVRAALSILNVMLVLAAPQRNYFLLRLDAPLS